MLNIKKHKGILSAFRILKFIEKKSCRKTELTIAASEKMNLPLLIF